MSSDRFHHSKWRPAATAAILRRASTFDDLYYSFSDNSLNRPKRCHSLIGALIDNLANLDNLFNKDP